MAIQRTQGRWTTLLATVVVVICVAASSAAAQSTGCVTPKPFSPQDGGLHAVILKEWGATVGRPGAAACDNSRATTGSSRPHGPSNTRQSTPPNMRGRDQLSIPGWPNELPF